jgi:hypothetical protein
MAKRVVISLFDDEATADSAAVALKDSGIAKHDAIGVLVLDERGDLKTHQLGAHSLYKGAGIVSSSRCLGPSESGSGRPRAARSACCTTRALG